MKKTLLFIALFSVLKLNAQEKVWATKNGKVKFKCESKVETIEAANAQATIKVASTSGQIVCFMLIKGFKFENSTMEEHFNENYMETTKFPKADFKGNIENIKAVDFAKDGVYNISVKGTLTIHGVAKPITEKATITVKSGKVGLAGNFTIKLTNFGIKGEGLGTTIANECQLNINCELN